MDGLRIDFFWNFLKLVDRNPQKRKRAGKYAKHYQPRTKAKVRRKMARLSRRKNRAA